jgi:deazaflavin-dependent oxidoreductase (nitroreductase family)
MSSTFVATTPGGANATNRTLMPERYVAPDWFTRNIFNRLVAALTRLGVSVWGSRVLEVRGRKTGQPRRTPVNLLTLDSNRYLVAPRGHTQWVRNLRAAGQGELLLGRRHERFIGVEIADSEKEPILRAYLKRWKWEVGQFFGGVDADSSSEDVRRIAPDHPIFRIETPPPAGADTPAGPPPPSG